MKRLRSYYCWDSIGDWLEAQRCGLVEVLDVDAHQDVDKINEELIKVLRMAECDCFPKAIVCLKKGEGYCFGEDRLISYLFKFLNNEVFLTDKNKKIFFREFDSKRKNNILDAGVHAIWIDVSMDEGQGDR